MCRKLIYLTSCLLLVGLASASTVWNPAANGIVPPATGDWGVGANWTNDVPGIADNKAVFNVPDAAECVVTDAQTLGDLVQGDGSDGGVIRIQNGGSITTTGGWAGIGYNSTANLIVEDGGTMNFGGHSWIGFQAGAVGTVDINGGTVNVAGMFGLGWDGGDGYVNVNDGGLLALSNIHGDGVTSIKQNSLLSINGTGMVTLPGDFGDVIDAYAEAGLIAGDGVLGAVQAVVADDVTTVTAVHPVINVATVVELEAAAAAAVAGDKIVLAEGTYAITSPIEITSGVTYMGAGAGLTIINGNNVTRAFVAWGDRGATNGQVDENGNSVPNATGPTGWVLDGLTIQNCVSDSNDRQDILSSARDLLNNYTGTPYTLATAQAENTGITENPGWFDILSGSADDDLTDAELQAYLDGNPVGSAGHLVVNDDKNRDGGAIFCGNGAVGTIANCDFLNNSTPIDGDDGGAISISGLSVITINDCLFDGNYAVSPDAVTLDGPSGHGGHLFVQGGSASAITPGTTLIANRCVFLNGKAEDDGGVMRTSAVGSIVRLDACWFEGNTAADDGTVLFIGNESSSELTVTNCVFANNISAGGSDRMCQVRRNSKFINCTFVGNNQDDQDMIYNNANAADTDADGVDDEMADATQVVNCIFLNNVAGNGDDVLGSRNDSFTIAATNCLFFGNTLQNGNAADNTQRPADEAGSILADPLLDVLYVPGAGSPAIDAGVDPATVGVTLTTDYNGDARPQGAAYDIGAYEIAAAPTEPGIVNVPKTSVAPIIDGQWDAVWNDVDETRCLITDMINTDSAPPEDLNDLSAIFKTTYDDNNFYILVEVQDSVIDYEFSNHNGDGVEIYFDGDNSKGDSYDGINDNQIRITVDDVELANIDSSLPVDGAAFSVLLTDLGYNVEASFPLAKLQVSPDTIFGFEVQINDNDSAGGRETLMRWYSDDNDSWQNPSLFGEAVLEVPTNLVQNGGFDDGSAWVILEHTVPAVTTIDPAFMDDAPSQGVAPCLRIASADNDESRPIVYQKLTLVAGQEYMVSSAIKILDATPASPSGTWFQIYMSPEEPDPVPEQTIDWNPPYKIFNIDAWGSNIADFIGFDGLFADGSQSFQVGDGTGLYVPPGEAGTEVDIFLVIKPGQCCRVGSYDILFDNVSVYAK